jgi:hypothetical protein
MSQLQTALYQACRRREEHHERAHPDCGSSTLKFGLFDVWGNSTDPWIRSKISLFGPQITL